MALRLFSMIHAGDRILVHLSGGKSSLALLHCLHAYQDILREENSDSALKNVFEMGAVVVALAHENYDLLPLVNYLKSLGVTYYYERQDMNKYCSHSLDLCSSLKQKVIYNVARKYGYNVLALAQNLDEMAASFLSSVFNNGSIQTMEANVELKDLNLRLIRPLAFCRENAITSFVNSAKLPVIRTACPICEQSRLEQTRLKEMLMSEENNNPNLFNSIISAISPLLQLSSQSDLVLEANATTKAISWTK